MQQRKRNKQVARAMKRSHYFWSFFGLLSALQVGNVYSLPGTPHNLIQPTASVDTLRQQALQQTVISNTVSSTSDNSTHVPIVDPLPKDIPDDDIPRTPYSFVVETDGFAVTIDSGTNSLILNNPRHFKNFQPMNGSVKGINGTPTLISGTGEVPIRLVADDGNVDVVTMRAVYVPSSPYNLMPPQMLYTYLHETGRNPGWFKHNDQQYVFQYHGKDCGKLRTLTTRIDQRGMFAFQTEPGFKSFFCQACHYQPEFQSYAGFLHTVEDDAESNNNDQESENPMNIQTPHESTEPTKIPFDDSDFSTDSPAPIDVPFGLPNAPVTLNDDPNMVLIRRKQHRLVVLHEKFGHLSFATLKLMARAGLIPRELATVDPPVCPGCAYGKAHRKPWRRKGTKNRRQIKTAIKPGQVISIDQLISPTPGFVPTHRGRPTTARYVGATVFVDHYSDFTYVHLMTKMDAESTIEAKLAFERTLGSHGVKALHYHADNGLFDTKLFKEAIQKAGQTLSFCGVNAHHQNGRAENRIRDITQGARTALLHAAHRWPKAISPSLWPAALKNYVNLKNSLPTQFVPGERRGSTRTPDRYEQSPISKLCGTEIEPNLDRFHPFGSPVYVLENTLQAQQPHNKWSDRSRVGIFMCHSPNHSTSVPLILNTQTGNVSPQFHCIYDDDFDTCKRDAKFVSLWQAKAWLQSKPDTNAKFLDILPTQSVRDPTNGTQLPDAGPPPPEFTIPWEIEVPNKSPRMQGLSPIDDLSGTSTSAPITQEPEYDVKTTLSPMKTRSGRQLEPHVKRLGRPSANSAFFNTFSPGGNAMHPQCQLQPDVERFAEPHPFAFMVETLGLSASSDPDTMTLDEALRQPDREQFIAAMHKELEDHISRKHWKVVPAKTIPSHKRAIPMVWSMKRKRDPLGNIVKWKARLCAGGHRSIEMVDYWSTYSPVISWSTVRLIIVFALINNWYMESIDFVLAFPQAPIKTDIYMKPPKVPPDFRIPDLPNFVDRFLNVYKLLKNLYGLKDAGKTWFEYLSNGLQKRGWVQSQIDSCLFTKDGLILVVYVDDAIIISADKEKINSEIKSLQQDYVLTDDGELKDYLGTRFTRHPDGSIELSQPHMVNRILEMVGITSHSNTKMHDTPALDSKLLDNDPEGAARVQSWDYRSVVGSLSYLQAMVRPDITMAVQQCARFCNKPQRQHEEAVKRICRYLLKEKNRGLIMRPDCSRGLECYVDADWAGSWQDRSSNDPLSSHSRTGYVILYAGCPIIWASKMQSLIALSTTEAEYIALSTALREVIAVMNLLRELKERGFVFNSDIPQIKCKVFEDNKSCIEIATNHRTRPRTKHLSVRLHHFRSHVVAKTICINHISTKEQLGDIFTKPLPRDQFRTLSSKIMGWS